MNEGKVGGSVFRHPLMFNPPPKEDRGKKSELSREQAIKKYPNYILIPTRYVGVSICLKGEV